MKTLLLLPFLAFFGVSCSVNTPEQRIEDNPDLYSSLSNRHKALIQKGQIENGMRSRAVYLAWGNPDSQAEGQSKGKTFQRWSYNSLRPIYSQSIYGGFGYGFGSGRYGRGRGGYYPYNSFNTRISYVPERVAWVKFVNGRVESWQRGQAQ